MYGRDIHKLQEQRKATLGVEAARILNRRFRAKTRYRIRRDRKIAVDWIGKEFDWMQPDIRFPRIDIVPRVRLVKYNPDTHTVVLHGTNNEVGSIVWTTDSLWFMLRTGKLLPC